MTNQSTYQISSTYLDETLLRLEIKPNHKIEFGPKNGQYLYLQLEHNGERHAFSILDCDKISGVIHLAIRVIGDFTRVLSRLKVGDRLIVDGFYGHYTQNIDLEKPVLLVAGGVGIAPFWPLINRYPDKLNLIYCTSSLSDSVNLVSLQQLLGARLNHHIGNLNRLQESDIEQVIKSITGRNNSSIQVYICAGKNLTKMVKNELLRLGVKPDSIHIEEFGY